MGGVGGGKNSMYNKSQPQPVVGNNGMGPLNFDNLGFTDEENILGSGLSVPLRYHNNITFGLGLDFSV